VRRGGRTDQGHETRHDGGAEGGNGKSTHGVLLVNRSAMVSPHVLSLQPA
jgi:hypothetical protein